MASVDLPATDQPLVGGLFLVRTCWYKSCSVEIIGAVGVQMCGTVWGPIFKHCTTVLPSIWWEEGFYHSSERCTMEIDRLWERSLPKNLVSVCLHFSRGQLNMFNQVTVGATSGVNRFLSPMGCIKYHSCNEQQDGCTFSSLCTSWIDNKCLCFE